MKRAALQRCDPFRDELIPAVDQPGFLGAALERSPGNIVVIRFIGLSEVRCIGERNRAFCSHPVQRGARVEAAGKRDADLLFDRDVLKNSCHGL